MAKLLQSQFPKENAVILQQQPRFTQEQSCLLSKYRIIQKNLVHAQGFPESLKDKSILAQFEYFGQFGKILKIVSVSKEDEVTGKKTNSAYITYSDQEEAAYAVLSVDSLQIDNHLIRVFFGTSKYCLHFLNNNECYNKEKCMYLHSLSDDEDVLGTGSKFSYTEHLKIAKEIVQINNVFLRQKILSMNIQRTFFPNKKSIYKDMPIQDNTVAIDSNITPTSNGNVNGKHVLYKYKERSRFFHDYAQLEEGSNDIPPPHLRNLIDELVLRIPFFMRLREDDVPLKQYELHYSINKLKNYEGDDSWLEFLFYNNAIDYKNRNNGLNSALIE